MRDEMHLKVDSIHTICLVFQINLDTTLQKFMRRRKFKLHSAFLDASMIGIYDSPVEFEVSIGNYGNRLDEYLAPCVCSTQPTNPVFDGEFSGIEIWGYFCIGNVKEFE